MRTFEQGLSMSNHQLSFIEVTNREYFNRHVIYFNFLPLNIVVFVEMCNMDSFAAVKSMTCEKLTCN
jgi:hypothetical protein